MRSYSHPNSSVTPPTMGDDAWTLYQAVTEGGPLPAYDNAGQDVVEDLRIVAERIACDRAIRQLRSLEIEAFTISVRKEMVTYCTAAAYVGPVRWAMDAEAATRIAQRVGDGLSAEVALARTLAQCEQPTYSEGALRQMEHEADAHIRRVLQADRLADRLRR